MVASRLGGEGGLGGLLMIFMILVPSPRVTQDQGRRCCKARGRPGGRE